MEAEEENTPERSLHVQLKERLDSVDSLQARYEALKKAKAYTASLIEKETSFFGHTQLQLCEQELGVLPSTVLAFTE